MSTKPFPLKLTSAKSIMKAFTITLLFQTFFSRIPFFNMFDVIRLSRKSELLRKYKTLSSDKFDKKQLPLKN